MNLLHLHYFYVVAREGGFTAASRVLRIQQPAISRMVAQLEDSFGFALFEKVGRNVQLTERGREVFGRAREIFTAVDGLKSEVGQLAGQVKGPLAFAAGESIASHLVAGVLVELRREHPDLYPLIHTGSASPLVEKIESGDLEFGLFFHLPELGPKLKTTSIQKIRYHLVVDKESRRQKNVLESFIGSREIDDGENRRFPTLEKWRQHQPGCRIRISCNNQNAHREMVLKGLGISVLPEFLIGEDLKSGRLVDLLPKETLEFHLKLVERRVSARSLNAQTFLSACEASARQL